jgi:hypothetical protein
MAMQFLNIFLACNIFWVGKTLYNYKHGSRKSKVSVSNYLLFYSFDSHFLYVHITCSPLHTSFHSCSLYFVRSHIETKRITGEDEGVFTSNVKEEIQRCMLVLLFHIPLLCISFIVCICVHLIYYM